MATAAKPIEIKEARRLYEEEGLNYSAIGRELGFTAPTVAKWAKKAGWVKAQSVSVVDTAAAIEAEDTFIETAEEQIAETVAVEQSDAALRSRLAELEERNRRLEAENEELKPSRDVAAYVGDRVQWLTDNSPEGEKYWLNRAEAKFKRENRQRAKEGLPVFNIKDHPDILDEMIAELKTAEAIAMDREPTEPPSRKVKLMIVRNGMPTIEQIPMENQINNMAGSLADGIIRYTRKGFKLTDPFLCPRAGCFRPAASDEFQRWQYDGYCTERHRAEVEGAEASPTAGLTTKDSILSGIS